MESKYRQSIDDLERGVRVPGEQQIEAQDIEPPREYIGPEEFDRLRLLAPESAGRLNPRS